ncbi:unnamed protein product [Ixodes hexagonus]
MDAIGRGPAFCIVNNAFTLVNLHWIENIQDNSFVSFSPQHFRCLNQSNKTRLRAGTEVLFVFGPSSDETERVRDELFRLGFVETGTVASPISAGPELKSSSLHHKYLRKLLGRAFEAGLFERAERLSKFRGRIRREFKYGQPSPTGESALRFSDIRPCLIIWALGIGLSLLVFAVRSAISRAPPLRPRVSRHRVHKAR